MLSHLFCDARLAWRGLTRTGALLIGGVVLLAIGAAGTTTMLALVDGVLLRPLPVPLQERVILAWKDLRTSGYRHHPFGDRAIEHVRDHSRLLERVAGVTTNGLSQWTAVEGDSAAYVKGALVTGAFFDVLDVQPLLGRRLTPADDLEGSDRVVVISARLWQRRFGGAPDVVGRRISLDDGSFAIAGVMPPDVDYPVGVEVWRPARSVPLSATFGAAARQEVDLIARLRPGVTREQIADELTALTRQFEAGAPPGDVRGLTPVVRAFDDVIVGSSRAALLTLLAAVGLVLLIASANVANLLLLRAEARRAELAVHMALGAAAHRLARQLVMEGVVLAVLGALLGATCASAALQAVILLAPEGLPRLEAVRVDAWVVGVVVLLTIATVSLAAVGPALLSSSLARASALGAFGRATTASSRIRRCLLVAQVALAVTVLAAAGLVIRTMRHLQAIDVGMSVDRLVVVFLELPKNAYADETRHAHFLSSLLRSLEAAPGVIAATPVNLEPFSGGWAVPAFVAEGQDRTRSAANPALGLEAVHENYFATLGIPILRGRAFTAADRKGALVVAIVSADVAARTWPGQDPIGRRLKWGSDASDDAWLTVVGVAATTRYQDLTVAKPTLYVPAGQFIDAAQRLVLRSDGPLGQLASVVREQVTRIDPAVRVMRISPFGAMFDTPLARPRFNAWLLGLFAGVALLLTCVGTHAVMQAHVRQRQRDIAIRLALGATAWIIRRAVINEIVWLAAAGALLGLCGAVATTRVWHGILGGVDALDPVSLGVAALVLILAAVLSTLASLRRVGRTDTPMLLRA